MHPKDGALDSPAFLGFVRRQRCMACVEAGEIQVYLPRASEAHHAPPIGMGGGARRDDHTIPLCRMHHDQAQTYEIPMRTQARWIDEVRSLFLETCTVEELRLLAKDLERWKSRPLATPMAF